MGRLFRSIRFWASKKRLEAAMRAYNEREAQALRRGCTQDIGHIREAKRKALHDALRGAR